jgi:hypothetical protein
LPRLRHQGVQHPEGFVAHGQDGLPTPQTLVADIKAEWPKDKGSRLQHTSSW